MLDERQFKSKAALGRYLGVSRVRVIQMLNLLNLAPEAISKLKQAGETFNSRFLGEKTLRTLVSLTPAKQLEKIDLILSV